MELNLNHRPCGNRQVKYVAMPNPSGSKDETTVEIGELKGKDLQTEVELTSRTGGVDEGDPQNESGEVIPELNPNINIYQNKKTVAQGMMDLALFSANATQLRYVLESNYSYFWPAVFMISTSLLFQVAIGVGLLLNTRYNVEDKKEICVANKISNFTIAGIFLVTVINVFICAFGVVNESTPVSASTAPGSGGPQ